jgi:putative flippase GtrA
LRDYSLQPSALSLEPSASAFSLLNEPDLCPVAPYKAAMNDTTLVRRWARFNAVGLAGVAVQLGCLWLLTAADMHYLPATLLAVEAAVVHNFAWHQRWTWQDRPATSYRAVAARFARFQALNGGISLVVNASVMFLLSGVAGLHPVRVAAAGIAFAALANYVASDRVVFARRTAAAGLAGLLATALPGVAAAQDTAAVDGWKLYEAHVDGRYHSLSGTGRSFFVHDMVLKDAEWRRVVLGGELSLRPLESPDVTGARIHHWAGAVFIPGTTVARVVEQLQGNAGHESHFHEDVVDSRLLTRSGERLVVFMRLRRTTLITATFDTEHAVEYRRLGSARASSRSVATRIVELADAGTGHERERGASDDRGFLWRLNAYWRFEQAGDGVIVECESVSLSRSVPALLRPVAGPLISRVARESLERTLREVRAVVIEEPLLSRRAAATTFP